MNPDRPQQHSPSRTSEVYDEPSIHHPRQAELVAADDYLGETSRTSDLALVLDAARNTSIDRITLHPGETAPAAIPSTYGNACLTHDAVDAGIDSKAGIAVLTCVGPIASMTRDTRLARDGGIAGNTVNTGGDQQCNPSQPHHHCWHLDARGSK